VLPHLFILQSPYQIASGKPYASDGEILSCSFLELQPKPIGSERGVRSDFQLIAGTNRDLAVAVRAGRFREDLLARMKLWTFRLPGLVERPADLEPNASRLASGGQGAVVCRHGPSQRRHTDRFVQPGAPEILACAALCVRTVGRPGACGVARRLETERPRS